MPAPSENGGRASSWGLLLLGAAIVVFGLGGASGYFYHRYVTREDIKDTAADVSDKTRPVTALGRIEPKDGVLPLGVPAPDRIRSIEVQEGDDVTEGKHLATLDSEVLRELELKLAKIQYEQAKTRLAAIEKNGEAQIKVENLRGKQIKQLEPLEKKALKSKIRFLEEELKIANKNASRYEAIGDTVAKQDIEKQDLARQQIQTELYETKRQLDKLVASNTLKREMVEAQLLAMDADLKQNLSAISPKLLETRIEEAKERLKDTRIVAPRAGKILRILKKKGELVHGEPIFKMANVKDMIVVAEVYETAIHRVKPDQPALITSHIFNDKDYPLKGRVRWIADSIGKSEVVPLNPRAAVDRRVVDVKIELFDPQRVARYIGHQVDVKIYTEPVEGSQ